MWNLPEIGEDEALLAVKVRGSPPLVTVVRVVAVAITTKKYGAKANAFDIGKVLAPRVSTLELKAVTHLALHDDLQPVVHGEPVALDAGQTVRSETEDRHT